MNKAEARKIYNQTFKKLVEAQRELDALSREMIAAGDGSVKAPPSSHEPTVVDALANSIKTCNRAYNALPDRNR